MDDEDDPVVEEIPVFLSKNLQDSLYLFQYPTKTTLPNLDDAIVVNCCVKPYTQQVKVNFGLDTDAKHYDRFKGEQFAVSADGKYTLGSTTTKTGERPTFKRGIMDNQAFTSTRSLTDVSKYIVGILTDKEMHLSPLTSIVQLRPALAHFDKEDKRRKAEQKAQSDDVDDEEALQQVTVKFARGGNVVKKAKAQGGGYDSFMKRIVDEPWCEAFWHARSTPAAELERQKMYASNQHANQSLSLQPSEYLDKLLPHDEHVQQVDTANVARVYNKAMLKTMPALEQVGVLLKDAKMLSFGDIMRILTEHIDPHLQADKVLALLPQVGILLHGNWVPKSEMVYPENILSRVNGVTAEQMIKARDYVIFRFSRTQFLFRNQVMAATQLPPAETLDVLSTLARVNSSKRWELLLPPDKEFEQKHSDLVQRQELLWRATEQTYNEMDWAKETKRVRKRSTRTSESQSTPAKATMPPPGVDATTGTTMA
ncbi:DNA-directed RNA polymerase III subunit RPC5 [Scaptodrosophila lebanonensis]|uniref:DNA-directed RNA polymerase III subunit RPC5 n=1 Tax=Drosophila lebanonensis TaxID=7225 RepID=A0A6J2T961_DROLE|nr:DNA-directed RNA polymerase III subunit RPC5 [Scaptodrosophila lebanonensis]